MPRKNRLHFDNACYHVMARGNFRQEIFVDENDYNYFYGLLKRSVDKYRCKIHLFCLMTNHIHLVVQVNKVPLSKIMQSIESTYSGYCNKKFNRQGHLFQGRFKDKIVMDRKYFIELIFYIHNNPLSAKLVNRLDDYPWSSHHVYNDTKELDWLTTEMALKIISEKTLFENYPQFMKGYKLQLASDDFEKNQPQKIMMVENFEDYFKLEQGMDLSRYSIQEIIKIICSELGMAEEIISSSSLKSELCGVRSLITYFAHYNAGYSLRDIACYLNRDADNISKTMHRLLSGESLDALIERLTCVFRRLIV